MTWDNRAGATDSGEQFNKLSMDSNERRSKSACTLQTLEIDTPSLPPNGQRSKGHATAASCRLSPYIHIEQIHRFLSTAVIGDSQWSALPKAYN